MKSKLSILVFLLTSGIVWAQTEPEPKDGKVTLELKMKPAAAPVPLGKLRLYPEYEDCIPGNRVQGLLKTFMEQDAFFKRVVTEEWQKYLTMPLADLPKDIREKEGVMHGIAYKSRYTTMMGYLDKGARYNRIEWNEWFDLRNDGFYLLIPEVQKLRTLASVVKLRLRGEIKNGEWDRACESVKTLFGIAQSLEQHPTLIAQLVAIAVSSIAIQGVEEMIQQPDCPNMYWALTELPNPVVSLRQGIGGERQFLKSSFSKFLTTERALSDGEVKELMKELSMLLKVADNKTDQGTEANFALIATNQAILQKVRDGLKSEKVDENVIKSMPGVQLAFLQEFRQYEILRDQYLRGLNLPYHEARKLFDDAETKLKDAKSRGEMIGPSILPSIQKVKQSQVRLDQRVAYLRLIEAIRLFAHENQGKLPTKLDQLGVPVPADPVSGKDFHYSIQDSVITMTGENPNPSLPTNNRVYKLSVTK